MSLGDIWGARDEPKKADIGLLMEKAALENRMHILQKIEDWFTAGPGSVMPVAEMETALGLDPAETAQLIQGVAAEIWTSARTITVFNAFDKLKSKVEAEQAGLV